MTQTTTPTPDRREYEMTEEDFNALLAACQPVPYMVFGGRPPASPEQNAARAWDGLGVKMGFVGSTARPVEGKGSRFFSAVPHPAPSEPLIPAGSFCRTCGFRTYSDDCADCPRCAERGRTAAMESDEIGVTGERRSDNYDPNFPDNNLTDPQADADVLGEAW